MGSKRSTIFAWLSLNTPPAARPWRLRYGVALAGVLIGFLGRTALTSSIGPTALPFIFFFPSITVVAWYGGFKPAVLSIILAGLTAVWFFIEPLQTFKVRIPEIWGLLAFSLSCFLIVGAIEMMHRARAGLTRSRDLLSTTLASIGDGVIVTDEQGRVTFLNPEAEHLTRWKSIEARGHDLPKVFRIINEETRQPAENPVEKVLRFGKVVGLANHTLLIANDGTEIPIDDCAAPIHDPGGSRFGVVLVFRDSSEQRKAQEARNRLATIVDSSEDAIISKNLEGKILTWNASAERMFGYSADEIIGKPVTTLIPPELHQQEEEIRQRLCRGQASECLETMRLTKDGRRITVSVSVSPLKDNEGHVIGASTILRDVSDAVAARQALAGGREELEREVDERTTKLKEILREMEAFTYTVAHDLRSPLRAIAGCSELLIEEHGAELSTGSAPEYLRKISDGARKMDELIRDLLEYSHLARTDLKLDPVPLEGAVTEALAQQERLIKDRNAQVTVDRPLPVVQAHGPTLTRVLANLVSNAVKFVSPGKTPVVRVRSEPRKGRVRLWVEDNGIGIEAAYLERIFRVFERLNRQEEYPGTGIGLAIVRRAVERMGGRSGVESTPGQGSRFWIDLHEVSHP
jgi:PAS domain S-box-containing protein